MRISEWSSDVCSSDLRASLFWYHSHTHRQTGPQVYHGLAGPIYVRDEASERLDLPNDYGIDDIPLIIQDRAFNTDGSFAYSTSMMNLIDRKSTRLNSSQ